MTLADDAHEHGLERVGARPSLARYLAQTWQRREFIYALAKFRLESETGQTRLGLGWVVIRPLFLASIYATIFGILLGGRRPEHFALFVVIGVFMFEFFSSSFAQGAKSIVANRGLVRSLSFPRIALPVSVVTQKAIAFIPTIALMLIIVMASGIYPRPEWLLLIPLIVIYYFFNVAVSLITARLTVHFRDLSEIIPVITRLLFYTSGIFFSFEARFPDFEIGLKVVQFQPINEFLSLARGIVLEGPDYTFPQIYWLYVITWTVALLIIGVIFFWSAEERYGRAV